MTTETIATVDTAEHLNAPIVSLVVVAILLAMMTAEGMMTVIATMTVAKRSSVVVQTNTIITTITAPHLEEEALLITGKAATAITEIATIEIVMMTGIATVAKDQKDHAMTNTKADQEDINKAYLY